MGVRGYSGTTANGYGRAAGTRTRGDADEASAHFFLVGQLKHNPYTAFALDSDGATHTATSAAL